MTVGDDTKAVISLTTRLGDRKKPSLSPGRWAALSQRLRDAGLTPANLFEDALPGLAGDELEEIRELLNGAGPALLELDRLSHRGIWAVSVADDRYPRRLEVLGSQRPPVIFGAGDPTLLDGGAVGVVGSRNVDDDGAAVAGDLARAAASDGLLLVSGGARGVDSLAMNAAYEAGGSVVGVLADSLSKRVQSPGVLKALDYETTCLVSMQHPDVGFSPAAAMARNKLIYALSDVTVVVASDEDSGGTWSGATEALRRGYGKVAVWRGLGEGPGNAALEAAGALPIRSAEEALSLPSADEASSQLRLLD